ncbi:MAG TPA: hypothetical protein VGR00_00490 [Thermoanaerobaculia bacterium]|nr:hypothetical protein [Thermoanaerobaculia bacterium]
MNITARVRFAAAPDAAGTGGPVLARSLGAGRQFYVTDVVAWLRTNGYAFPNDASSKLGTLFVSFDGVSDPNFVYAGSRVSTANPNTSVGGSFGLYTNAVRSGTSSSGEAWVYGLRESAAYRSNLAVVHAPAAASSLQSGSGPIEIEIDVVSGDTGFTVGSPIRRTLQPGEFFQVNGILATAGVTNGYARVRRVSGTDGFIAYGVVNDGGTSAGTSDGSFLPSGGSEGLVPIVLDLPGATHYQTDLSLTNPGTSQTNVSLGYIPSKAIAGATGGGTVTISLGAGRQLLIPNAIAYLRSLGLPIPDDGSKQGGALVVQGAIAIARTFNPNPDSTVGGTFGVAYPAVGPSSRAVREAFVYGLRQDADVRSNLAIVDARFGLSSPLDYTVDVYDADTGSAKPAGTRIVPLTGGDWIQLDSILAAYGVAHGYVRVRPATETSDFVVYGVVNDGPVPGSRTSDGSYLPMVVP